MKYLARAILALFVVALGIFLVIAFVKAPIVVLSMVVTLAACFLVAWAFVRAEI